MIEVVSYVPEKKASWDQFIKNGKNSHFFFQRDYMEYHADRFIDASLLFYDQYNLLAVLPGNKHQETYLSHGGLTFGGLIVDKKIKTTQLLTIFSALKGYLKAQNFKVLRYKAIPHIYHEIPAEEDLYALFRNNAKLVRRDASSTIDLQHKLSFSGGKKNGIAKAKKNGVTVSESQDFTTFNAMMNKILAQKYQTKATHTTEEMVLLAKRFPENIKLHGAFLNGQMVAGTLMYVTKTVAHTQYMATTEIGREIGALDFLIDVLIHDIYASKRYFDFGISTEQQGHYLNEGLILQKEMFGARAVMYDTYEVTLD
jgi:hypothetical protein